MTTPVSLVPVAVPAVAPLATAPDDVFASVLAALSGALGLPVPAAPLPEGTPAPDTAAAPVAATTTAATATAAALAVPAGTADPAPSVWAAVTQRPVLPGTTPTAPVTARAGEAQLAPARHGTDAPAAAPATEEATRPEAAAPAVPAQETAPVPDAAAAAVTPPAVTRAAPPAEAPVTATTSTQHVKPALVEAARGLRHEGGGRTSLVVRLDPPELGAVLVRLTVQDGRVDVTLRTPDLAASADLQAQSYDVQQVLREQGFDLSSFDVAQGDVLPDGWGDAPDRGTPERGRRADGQPHTPVTDDGPAPEPSGTWL